MCRSLDCEVCAWTSVTVATTLSNGIRLACLHLSLEAALIILTFIAAAGFYCKHDELEMLYSNIAKFIHDGLSSYDKYVAG